LAIEPTRTEMATAMLTATIAAARWPAGNPSAAPVVEISPWAILTIKRVGGEAHTGSALACHLAPPVAGVLN
jgi:hypothetical protein